VIPWRVVVAAVDYAAMFASFGITIGLYFAVGLWCLLTPVSFLLGGVSYAAWNERKP
jgi:hypothetical protein